MIQGCWTECWTIARIAKVLLTRNPLDSYVSRKIASATGQWRLTDLKDAKTGKITFDELEFTQMLDDWSGFREHAASGSPGHGADPFSTSGTRTSTMSIS
jgi:hypothetical protein